MQTLQVIVSGLIALGLLVFVHELGHFLVAKLAGIRVLKFSLGFGRRLLGFKRGDTEYLISVLPLGGYVKLAGEQPEEGQAVQPGDYFSRPWWVRLLVLLAGPAMNLAAAVLVLGTLFWVGFPVPMAKPQIFEVTPRSAAHQAGLAVGDVIVGLDGEATDDWEAFSRQLNRLAQAKAGGTVQLDIMRSGDRQTVVVTPRYDQARKQWLLGVSLMPAGTNVIERVFVGTPAEMAGFRADDRVLTVEGRPVWTKYDFQQALKDRAGVPTRMQVERDGRQMELQVTPMSQQMPKQGKVGIIGVNFKTSDQQRRVQYPLGRAYTLGALQTWTMSRTIVVSIWQMLTGQISAKDSVGGPISIVRMAGQEARSGVQDFFFFLAGISIMLAILNLLPIPVMDGGNAVFFIWEGIFGRPVSLQWQQRLQIAGLALLVALMVYATYNDLYKLIAPALRMKP